MSNSRAITYVILLLVILHGAAGWFCYSREIGSDHTTVSFCPYVSCFSVGGSVIGITDAKKGCADKRYPNICQSMDFKGLVAEHVCFCNTMFCNASSMPSVFLPLLVLPCLLQKLM